MKTRLVTLILFLAAAFIFSSCATSGTSSDMVGGTEAGNPPASTTRLVKGQVEPASESGEANTNLVQSSFLAESCVADTVIVHDPDGNEETNADIEEDCSFEVVLSINQTYAISFTKQDVFIGTIYFSDSEDQLPTPYIYLTAGEDEIDLGVISFTEVYATVETPPSTVDNLNNADDDESTSDDETAASVFEDCDLDGVLDSIDADTSDCSTDSPPDAETGPKARVLEVSPTHNAGISNINLSVSLGATVQARFNCDIDFTTVDAQSFSVVDDDGEAIACEYSLSSDGKTLSCTHSADLFSAFTVYTATIDGVSCDGGTVGDATTWSFITISLGLL